MNKKTMTPQECYAAMTAKEKREWRKEAADAKVECPEFSDLVDDVVTVGMADAAQDFFKAAQTVCNIHTPDKLAKAFRQMNIQLQEMAQGRGIAYALGYLMTNVANGTL